MAGFIRAQAGWVALAGLRCTHVARCHLEARAALYTKGAPFALLPALNMDHMTFLVVMPPHRADRQRFVSTAVGQNGKDLLLRNGAVGHDSGTGA